MDEVALGFYASYPVEQTRREIIDCLRNEYGLAPMLVRHPRCVLQWAPFSKLDFNRSWNGTLIVSSYYSHHGLVSKSRLMDILQGNGFKFACAHKSFPSLDIGAMKEFVLGQPEDTCWVLKASKANNASCVFFLNRNEKEMEWVFEQAAEVSATNKDPSWLLQEYVSQPLLFEGRKKFHVRCNVLAVGSLSVFVHQDMVLHVACEDYVFDKQFANRYVHVTNHIVQREHANYDANQNMRSLDELPPTQKDKIMGNIMEAVSSTFRILEERGNKQDFFPTPDTFELFGFDFLIQDDEDCTVKLLEINSGPALEGHLTMLKTKHSNICRQVIRDTLAILLKDWLIPGMQKLPDTSFEPKLESTNRFVTVYGSPRPVFLSTRFKEMILRITSTDTPPVQEGEIKREEKKDGQETKS